MANPEDELLRLKFGATTTAFQFHHRFDNYAPEIAIDRDSAMKLLQQLMGSKSGNEESHGGKQEMMASIIQFIEELEARDRIERMKMGRSSPYTLKEIDDAKQQANGAIEKIEKGEIKTREDLDKYLGTNPDNRFMPRLTRVVNEMEVSDAKGNRIKLTREELIQMVGSTFGKYIEDLLEREVVTRRIQYLPDVSTIEPVGTVQNAMFRERSTSPSAIKYEDIISYQKEKAATFWFLIDFSGSMGSGIAAPEGAKYSNKLTKLDVAKTIGLGLASYFTSKEGSDEYRKVVLVPVSSYSEQMFTPDMSLDDFITLQANGSTPLAPVLKKVLQKYQDLSTYSADDVILILSDGEPNGVSEDFKYAQARPYLGLPDGVDLPEAEAEVRHHLLEARQRDVKVHYVQIDDDYRASRRAKDGAENGKKKDPKELMLDGICEMRRINDKDFLEDLGRMVLEGLY